MELVITAETFRRLSSAAQNEILALLLGTHDAAGRTAGWDEMGTSPAYSSPVTEDNAKRRVFAISAAQASELLSNLAEKSQQTLRLFAERERVAVEELIGAGHPYKDMSDLKRSFVGAVNRRLRTVVGNRAVVLFSSDRDRKRIRVVPSTALALRQAMGIQELAEEDEDFDGFDFESPPTDEPPYCADLSDLDVQDPSPGASEPG